MHSIRLAAQTPPEVQKIAEQAIRRLDLQSKLPTGPESPRLSVKMPPEILWLVIAVALGVLLYALRDLIPSLWLRQAGEWASDDGVAGAVSAREPAAVVGAADELAAVGHFVEAMHVLLLQGLADICRRLDEPFADSLTSREILRTSTRLPDAGRAALRDIVERVEWTYFGQNPAVLADYVACRSSFNALAEVLHGTMPDRAASKGLTAA